MKAAMAGGLKAQLQALSQEDTGSVLIVRRIQKLGFKSPDHLREHFKEFGEVKDVHVAHSTVKSMPRPLDGQDVSYRQRPAALGFVVMASPEAAQKILAEGKEKERDINGVKVLVQAFHRNDVAEKDEDGQSGDEAQARGGGRPGGRSGQGADGKPGGARQRRERDVDEDSPLCFICGSTIASHLGIVWCQVCRRGYAIDPRGPAAPDPYSGGAAKAARRSF